MKRYRKQDNALINNKPNWFISNILLHILMRNIILFLLRFPVEGNTTQVFTQNVDVNVSVSNENVSNGNKASEKLTWHLDGADWLGCAFYYYYYCRLYCAFFRISATSNMEF